MNALLELFKIKLNKADFEYQGSKYRIEFAWTDGLKQFGKNEDQSNMQNVGGTKCFKNYINHKICIAFDKKLINKLYKDDTL